MNTPNNQIPDPVQRLVGQCAHGVFTSHRCRDCEDNINEEDLIKFQRRELGMSGDPFQPTTAPIDCQTEQRQNMSDITVIHSSIRKACHWPRGKFKMIDESDPHGHTWLVLPDGQMVDVSHHCDPSVNPAQVAWMVDVLNHALALEDNPPETPITEPTTAPKETK